MKVGKLEIFLDSGGFFGKVSYENEGIREERMQRDNFEQMRDQVHRLMNSFFKEAKPLGYQSDQSFRPPMDIYETEENLVIMIEVAGMKSEAIRVHFNKGILSMQGARAEPSAPPKIRLHQLEIDYGNFGRSLRIPFPVNADGIKANYREGFLFITVPKGKEPLSKTVEVKIR